MRKLLWLIGLLTLVAVADEPEERSTAKLYLTSAAINVLDELVPLLPFPADGRTACYVTTAGNLEGSPPWMDQEIEAIEKTSFSVRRIDLARLSAGSLANEFQGCDVIWVGGGNTYYLLQEVRRSGFDKFVIEKISDGVPYVGTSAGSLILAPNIECIKYAEEHPDFELNLDSLDGLNVFPLVPFVHFDNPTFRDVYQKILMDALENDVSFITLRDNQFIYVDGETWKVIDSD